MTPVNGVKNSFWTRLDGIRSEPLRIRGGADRLESGAGESGGEGGKAKYAGKVLISVAPKGYTVHVGVFSRGAGDGLDGGVPAGGVRPEVCSRIKTSSISYGGGRTRASSASRRAPCITPCTRRHNMHGLRTGHSQLSQSDAHGSHNMHIQNFARALPFLYWYRTVYYVRY